MKLSLICLVFLFACSTAHVVKTESPEGVNFQNFKTFDFYKLEASGDTSSKKFSSYTDLLKQAVSREMLAKGYAASSQNPDILINLGIVVTEETQTRQTDIREAPRYIGQRRYSWKSQEVEVGKYKTGTVTIDLVESKANKMVWQGVLEGIIAQREKSYESDINKGVTALFKKYPN